MELTNDGLIAAYILDKKGGGRQIAWDGIDSWQPDQGLLWIHFDYSSQNVQEWLFGKSGLEEVIVMP